MDKGLPPVNHTIEHQPSRETDSPDIERPEALKSLPEPEKLYVHKPIPGRKVLIKGTASSVETNPETPIRAEKKTNDLKEKISAETANPREAIQQKILSGLPVSWKQMVATNSASPNDVKINQKHQEILDYYLGSGMNEGLTQLFDDLELTRSIAEQLASNNDFGLRNLLTDSLNCLTPIQNFWEQCLQCSSTTQAYSSSHPQHQLIGASVLPEEGAQTVQQDTIKEEFNQDFHRNLEVTAYLSGNKLAFHARVSGGEYQFLQYRNDKPENHLNFKVSGSRDEDSSNDQINKQCFFEHCQNAVAEFAGNNPELTVAIMDLTTQTAGNALWLFFDQTYGAEYHFSSPLSSINAHCRSDFYTQPNGNIVAKLTLKSSGFEAMTDDARIQIRQPVTINTQILLKPANPADRRLGDITVQIGELKSITLV